MHPHPPERFHLFLSYTTREDEIKIVKPFVDRFLETYLRPIIEQTIGEPPIFYDGYSLSNRNRWFADSELARALLFAVEESEALLAFISPSYFSSPWCIFELTSMGAKEFRPWFDLCRRAPVPELEDKRPAERRPSWWDCIHFRFLMRRWRARQQSRKPGGVIVPILLENGVGEPLTEMRDCEITETFDWRVCWGALAVQSKVATLRRYGRVSSSLEARAHELEGLCQESMIETALAIAEILRRRRLQYVEHHR